MPIVRWEPFRDLYSAQDRLNRLFNETRSRQFVAEDELAARPWSPPVDIYETDHELILKAELPGIDPNDVEIRVEDNTLYLKGERRFEKNVKEESFHRIERSYGAFTRSFVLPNTIAADKVSAGYKDGILTLTMPKKEEAKPKTIKISVSND